MKKLNKTQLISIALMAILGIIVIYFIAVNGKAGIDIEYPYTTAIESTEVPGDIMMGIIHDRDGFVLSEIELGFEFHYNLARNPVAVYIDHPMYGIPCALVEYSTELEGNTVIINETQDGDCDETKQFYITTALTESRPFSKVRINQIVNGETIETKEFEIDPEIITK